MLHLCIRQHLSYQHRSPLGPPLLTQHINKPRSNKNHPPLCETERRIVIEHEPYRAKIPPPRCHPANPPLQPSPIQATGTLPPAMKPTTSISFTIHISFPLNRLSSQPPLIRKLVAFSFLGVLGDIVRPREKEWVEMVKASESNAEYLTIGG